MRRVMLLAVTVLILAGSWNVAAAQAATSPKPAKTKKVVQPKPVEPQVAVETAVAAVDTAVAAVDTAPAPDTSAHDSLPKKKGGLFGKAKGIMKNKVVQQVAKVAACTMVPGGQVIAGAIDAASSKSAGEAAAGAAGAASGSSCMPGMGGAGMGAAGMTGAGMAAGGMGGGVAGLAAAGLAGGAARGMPQGAAYAAPGMAAPGMMPGGTGMGGDPTALAECMGLTVEEFNAMSNPTGSQPRAMTKAEMKRSQQLSKKVGPQRQMECNQQVGMQQASAQMAQMQQVMAQAQSNQPGPGAVTMSEAPGQPVTLGDDFAADLKKGKVAVRGIDWMAGAAAVSPAGRPAFDEAMARLGAAIKESGMRYRLDIYLEDRYDAAAVQAFGPGRLQQVQSSLAAVVGDTATVQLGKMKRDKNPRLEVNRIK